MSRDSFTLMWGKMLDSSVWMTDKDTRLVWVTMLLMKDAEGIVRAAVPGLAHRARVTVEECQAALKVLEGPDPYSSTSTEEGRRVVPLPAGGGWRVVNHEAYRFSTDAKRELWAKQKREQRDAKPKRGRKPSAAIQARYDGMERRAVEAAGNGDDARVAEIAAEGLASGSTQSDGTRCVSQYLKENGVILECNLTDGHEGLIHRSKLGYEWQDEPDPVTRCLSQALNSTGAVIECSLPVHNGAHRGKNGEMWVDPKP